MCERMRDKISGFMARGDNLTAEEERLLKMLVVLVESFEDRTLPMKDASPRDMLLLYMDQHKLRQADLVSVFGSRSVVSNVVNGKRSISKAQAKKRAEKFHTSADVFI
jgi:HTH-type transcriptional regulator / antitoxin HigA